MSDDAQTTSQKGKVYPMGTAARHHFATRIADGYCLGVKYLPMISNQLGGRVRNLIDNTQRGASDRKRDEGQHQDTAQSFGQLAVNIVLCASLDV
jgi:hypothetical protein